MMFARTLSTSSRRRLRRASVSFLGVSATFYFAYHVFHGDRGLMAWLQLRQQVTVANVTAGTVQDKRQYLESRVRLLHPASLDPDMLDERARLMLNFGHADELIILDTKVQASPEGETTEAPGKISIKATQKPSGKNPRKE